MSVMDTKLVERLLSSTDSRRMGDAAREMGLLFAVRGTSQLPSLLDAFDRVHRDDEYGRGFMAALRHVAHAFAATLEREQGDAELARLAEREGVRDVLVAFDRGDRTPTQIAERTKRQKSQVTALLKFLEDVGLVEEDEPQPDEDGRSRPRVLTTRGAVLARRLSDHADARVVANVDETVTAVVECVTALIARQHIARSELAEMLSHHLRDAAADQALRSFGLAAGALGLAVVRDDTCWLVEAQLQDVVGNYLSRAAGGDKAAMQALLPDIPSGVHILVRTGRQRDAWDRMKQVWSLESLEIIGPGEARLPPESCSEPFGVLYDSGALAKLDLESTNRTSFIDPASFGCWQHVVHPSTAPETFRTIPLEG